MQKVAKAALALNLAALIRGLRHGPREAARRLVESFDKIDPFGPEIETSPEALRLLNGIPLIDFKDIAPAPPLVTIDGRHSFTDGALPQTDLFALLALLKEWNPGIVLEIGTFNGATTCAIALNAPGAVVHTVDLPVGFEPSRDQAGGIPMDDYHLIRMRQVGAAYKTTPEVKNVIQHFADSATWDFAPAKGASFFFVDGSHTYEYAKNDTEKCLAIGAPRSRILIHDCDERHVGVMRYVNELIQQGRRVQRVRGTSLAWFDTA
jgi:hypothetical protein